MHINYDQIIIKYSNVILLIFRHGIPILEQPCVPGQYVNIWSFSSLQSRDDLDKTAPTITHLRLGCAKTVQKSSGAPLHYGYHSQTSKTSKSEGCPGVLS